MEFGWSEEQEQFRAELLEFIRKHRTPALVEELAHDEGGGGVVNVGPEAAKFRRALNEAGYTTMAWPEEYGGQGKGAFYVFILNKELNYWGLSGLSLIFPLTIMSFASEEQKREWLPKLQAGEMVFALGYTEPNAGTDLGSLQTRAVRDGDEWVINGQKIYTSGAHYATHIWLAARTDPDAPKHRGISLIVVPTDSPGLTVRPLWTMGKIRTNETFWEDVRVPAANLIGEENRGWYIVTNALDLERVDIGGWSPVQRFYDELVDYLVEERRDLLDDPALRTGMAGARMEMEIARALSITNATIIASGGMPTKESSMAKVWISEARARLTSLAVDLFGGFGGLSAESGEHAAAGGAFEQAYRDSPVTRFGGGTNDIQRRIIATRGLGLPRG